MTETRTFMGVRIKTGDQLYIDKGWVAGNISAHVTGFTPSGKPKITLTDESGQEIGTGWVNDKGTYTKRTGVNIWRAYPNKAMVEGIELLGDIRLTATMLCRDYAAKPLNAEQVEKLKTINELLNDF